MFSKHCSNTANKYNIKIGVVEKLAPNLDIKSIYVLHYNKTSTVFVIRNEIS